MMVTMTYTDKSYSRSLFVSFIIALIGVLYSTMYPAHLCLLDFKIITCQVYSTHLNRTVHENITIS